MDTTNYIDLQKAYGGEFIALYKDSIIAHATTFDALYKCVEDKIGDANLIIEYIEPYEAVCVYMDFFSKFNIVFDNKNEKIVLTPI